MLSSSASSSFSSVSRTGVLLQASQAQMAMHTTTVPTIGHGVLLKKSAKATEDTMPLPYCKEPIRAAAVPALSPALSRAAAVAQAEMIPLVAKIKTTDKITP